MKPHGYLWIVAAVLLSTVGADIVTDSVRHSGPYAEDTILLGATLTALGLAAILFAFKHHAQVKALNHHMRRDRRYPRD